MFKYPLMNKLVPSFRSEKNPFPDFLKTERVSSSRSQHNLGSVDRKSFPFSFGLKIFPNKRAVGCKFVYSVFPMVSARQYEDDTGNV